MRKRSTSMVLRTLLWLAYLSADTVAIFVLGHLAVRASEPRHQLMSFWAPFVLVHLGGQDTMSAFSKQDNELWTRHLLSLVTQVGVAGYVVAKASSWPDARLTAAMVIMFLSGFFKYAERTLCLYRASPASLRSDALHSLSGTLEIQQHMQTNQAEIFDRLMSMGYMRGMLHKMSKGRSIGFDRSFRWGTAGSEAKASSLGLGNQTKDTGAAFDIMSVDTPINRAEVILVADDLPVLLAEFMSSANRFKAYDYVGAILVRCYKLLYTKSPLRQCLCNFYRETFFHLGQSFCSFLYATCLFSPSLLYFLFQYASTPIALVLFTAAEKGGKLHTSSRVDIIVSYILLVGAIVLDASSAIMLIFSNMSLNLPACSSRKQWSEELTQYSMIKRHAVQETSGMASIRQWVGKRLGSWGFKLGFGLLEVTNTPVTKDRTHIKEFILDNLLGSGIRKEWNIASSRGRLALQKWMDGRRSGRPESASRATKALVGSVSSSIDFPTSVILWHIATEICYYFGDKTSTDDSDDQLKKHKEMSRELSSYIAYLVFKCGVMLTSNSQLLHDKVHDEIKEQQRGNNPGEKDVVSNLFKAKKDEEQQDSTVEIQRNEEPGDCDNADDDSHMQKLLQSSQNLYAPVLPRACEVAQELISITNDAERWGLIAAVWSEMLFYTAPRCGGAFHYEHLSTGGEFITHILLLMFHLGPFLPPPDS